MGLSDLQVYSDFTYTTFTEVLAQHVELFNAATQGALNLEVLGHAGDFADNIFYGAVPGLVRRRNPYGDGAIAEKVMTQKVDTMVKIGAGTPPVRIDPAWFAWINRSPQEAAAAMGQQLAKQTLADMLNVALGSVTAAISNVPTLINDVRGLADSTGAFPGPRNIPTPINMVNTANLLGDYMNELVVWVMHSKSLTDLYGNALNNNERLFTYGNVNVVRDPFGRVYVMADAPALVVPGSPADFHVLGLVPNAVDMDQSDDFTDNWSTLNGNENIKRTYQAEWSYSVGVKGFAWNKSLGGKAPNDASLFSSSSWTQVVTSIKDGPGVMLVSH